MKSLAAQSVDKPLFQRIVGEKGVFTFLINTFSCEFERQTQYIVAKLFTKRANENH